MFFSSGYYGTSDVMKARINKAQEKYTAQLPSRSRRYFASKNGNTVDQCNVSKPKPKIILDDNQKTTTLKKIGIGVGAAVVAYCSKNIIGACVGGLKSGGTAFKNFVSKHTKGSIHEALGGIYHAFSGTGKILTAPARGFAKLFKG